MPLFSESEIRVRYEETDQMKVVYHANYLVWFEIGRTDFIRNYLGFTYAQLEQRGILFPVIEANCSYRMPAKYDDLLLVRSTIQEMKGAQLTFAYQVLRKDDHILLAEGFTRHVFASPELKPVNLRRSHPDVYHKLLEFSK